MKKVITYGTYDLLHEGHLNLLHRAKELGDYLIVGVTSDSFDRGRGKLNVRNNVLERVEAVKATGYADEVIIEDYLGQKIDDIQRYNVDIFAIGSDWVGKFDYLNEYCKVIYLPRTEGISSTMLREQTEEVKAQYEQEKAEYEATQTELKAEQKEISNQITEADKTLKSLESEIEKALAEYEAAEAAEQAAAEKAAAEETPNGLFFGGML